MRWIDRIAIIALLSVSCVATAGSMPGMMQQGDGKAAKPAKPIVAVGATLDSGGRLWLAQVDNQRLLVSYSEDSGLHFSAPVTVAQKQENIAAEGESRPKIAVANDGTVLLTWTEALPQNYSGNIRFARSVDGGKTFTAPVTLNDDGRITSHRFDSLAIDGKGRVAVAWLDARDRDAAQEKNSAHDRDAAKDKDRVFSGVSVYTVQSHDNGTRFDANRRLVEHTCECCRTAMTWADDGPVVLWRNLYGTNTRDFAIASLDSGTVRRATDDEWQVDGCPHHGGGVAAAGETLHLVWFTNGKTRQGMFYKRIEGAAKHSNAAPNSNLAASQAMPVGNAAAQAGHAAVAASGKTVLLTWREFDGSNYVAQAMRSDDGGASWDAPQLLGKSSGAADYPLPLIDGRQTLVVWNSVSDGLRVFPVTAMPAEKAAK